MHRGNGASVLRIVPYAALHFTAYERYRSALITAWGYDVPPAPRPAHAVSPCALRSVQSWQQCLPRTQSHEPLYPRSLCCAQL